VSSYSVKNLKGCKVIKGTIPVNELVALLNAWGDEWVVDGELAHALNVNVVVGPAKEINSWRKELGLND
jgi:hypothetical protein